MTVRLDSRKWLLVLSLHLVTVFFNDMISQAGAGIVTSNSVVQSPPYNPLSSTKDVFQRRLFKGREVIPPVSSNIIPGEPSCEELRAMWRYYKRQSRAELTNEIPRFGSNLFWDIPPGSPMQNHQMSSFAPIKGRSKGRLKPNPKSPFYGRMIYKQRDRSKSKPPRPMDQVAQMMGKGTGTEVKEKGPVPDAIVHFSPPPTPVPTTPTSLQKIKDVFREERIRDKSSTMGGSDNSENGKAFGRIILGPPRGMDGRVANKPRELMTPFEKIRFGHANDLLEEGSKPNMNLMAKRRPAPIQAFRLPRLYESPLLVYRNSRSKTVSMNDNTDTSQWTDIVETDPFKTGVESGENDFLLDGNRWVSSLPDSVDEKEFVVERNPPGKVLMADMQQPQPFQSLKTFSSLPVLDLSNSVVVSFPSYL